MLSLLLFSSQNATNLERFQLSITKREMYPENARIVDNLVRDMTELPILHVGKLGNFVVWFFGGENGKLVSFWGCIW